jgi:hypothetical protein
MYGRDLSRKVYGLGDLDFTSLDWTLQVDIANLLAKIGLGANKTNKAILDSQENIGVLLNLLFDHSLCLDQEFLATIKMLVSHGCASMSGQIVRFGRVRSKVDLVNPDQVGSMVSGTQFEGRVARNLEVVADGNIGSLAIENAQSSRWGQACRQTCGDGRESHRAVLSREMRWVVVCCDVYENDTKQ